MVRVRMGDRNGFHASDADAETPNVAGAAGARVHDVKMASGLDGNARTGPLNVRHRATCAAKQDVDAVRQVG